MKRLPRYDHKSADPLHITQCLSEVANSVYDQLWLEDGGPNNIHIASLDKMDSYGYLKDIIYGKTNEPSYDGIHLRGPAAVRHFTYRAVNAIKSVFGKSRTSFSACILVQSQQMQKNRFKSNYQRRNCENGGASNYSYTHVNCL